MTDYFKIAFRSSKSRGTGIDAARRLTPAPEHAPRSATLSRREIRGIVAEMLG